MNKRGLICVVMNKRLSSVMHKGHDSGFYIMEMSTFSINK